MGKLLSETPDVNKDEPAAKRKSVNLNIQKCILQRKNQYSTVHFVLNTTTVQTRNQFEVRCRNDLKTCTVTELLCSKC